jgi:ribosomal protein S10
MLRLSIQTYNNLLLANFLNKLKTHSKFKTSVKFSPLPVKCKSFVVIKSPHVYGRSKEKYHLKSYSGIITFQYFRKKDLTSILHILKFFRYKEGLGFKFIFD